MRQKHKFGITCQTALFVESVPVPPDDEKYYVDVSCPGHTEIHYGTRRFHRIQKYKFGVTSPGALFMETAPSPPDDKKGASMFHAFVTPECTM
jgi:hypothetical protein